MSTEIYALLDDSGAIRYIGKTKQGAKKRAYTHWGYRHSRHNWDNPVRHWLRTLDSPPAVRTLAVVEDAAVRAWPRYRNIELAIIRGAKQRWPDQILNVIDGSYILNQAPAWERQQVVSAGQRPANDCT